MILTDTHTHQYLPAIDAQREHFMQRALQAGVSRLFLPNIDLDSIPQVLGLCEAYPTNCFPMIGLHPCSVKEDVEIVLPKIKEAIFANKVVAVGEIGLDLYWDKTFFEQQKWAFKEQIKWAKELNLPISIHCRDAFEPIIEILKEVNDGRLKGVFHCFTGSLIQAKQVIDVGLYLGIGGVVTYKNAGLDKVVADLDLKNIVLETDAPYLTPVPFRGKPNESAYLYHVAQKVADLQHCDITKVAKITTQNAKDIFGV